MAILAIPFPRVDANAYINVCCVRRFCAAADNTSYIIVRASFVPIHHSKQHFHYTGDPGHWRSRGRHIAQ